MNKILCKQTELQIEATFNSEQAFRWNKVITTVPSDNITWIGVFNNFVWLVHQENDGISYRVFYNEKKDNVNYENMLKEYFHLNIEIEHYYKAWSENDKYFKQAMEKLPGIRLLKQNVLECIITCVIHFNGQNTFENKHQRNKDVIETVCKLLGTLICEINGAKYYSFPNLEILASDTTVVLMKENGLFGKGKLIKQCAQKIIKLGGEMWLANLKHMEYIEAREALMTLPGIRPKAADNICLMSLDHLQVVPTDTNVYHVYLNLYNQYSQNKDLLESKYNDQMSSVIADYFRGLYGPLAGWACKVLFFADLQEFKPPEDLKKEESDGNEEVEEEEIKDESSTTPKKKYKKKKTTKIEKVKKEKKVIKKSGSAKKKVN